MTAWTQQDDDRLRHLWKAGHSSSVIARMLGRRTRNAVIGRARRLDLAARAPCGDMSSIRRRGKAKKVQAPPLRALSPSAQIIKAIKRDGLPLPEPKATDIPTVSFHDLEATHCRWICKDDPAGHPQDQPLYCGAPKVPGSSYCEAHLLRSVGTTRPYVPGNHGAKSREYAKAVEEFQVA